MADLVDLLKIESVSWNPVYQQEYSGLGSGEGLSHDLGPMLWEAECQTIQGYHAEVEGWRGKFMALNGSNETFMLYNPAAEYPSTDPRGEALDGFVAYLFAIDGDRKVIALAGLPAGFVVPDDAYIAVDYGSPSRRALLKVVTGATANGEGRALGIEMRPHLRPGITTGLGAALVKPAAKVKLKANSMRVETTGALTSRLRFSALQTLAAGGAGQVEQPDPVVLT
ncbi:hypothetical protein VE26_05605 [Devosia chinhatensis]|uniref:Uncharacterized protein n=1 Tax=Devosia chinhatensis TaxID=429727 RepID=A0A0F5FKN0_9HYPH|nr:hypothetical protein VE26_05605 [Devosia chinhatensis]